MSEIQETEEHTYKFQVAMTCGGCSGAVNRVLSKMEGLDIEKVDWESKDVIVRTKTGTPTYEEVKTKIARTGKKVLSGTDNGVVQDEAEA
ncbi:copper chaperone-like protein [Cystobasidium minutum MCA 4210]|uniref:copper chaperone-like protein n=1 Tax=Cystobasidium minutum MCA 4210 TaxID=1397322 RepID=UPI0034CD9C64|eukprot:jgi/Rhomi1/173826/fgenesh1_kg.6_\